MALRRRLLNLLLGRLRRRCICICAMCTCVCICIRAHGLLDLPSREATTGLARRGIYHTMCICICTTHAYARMSTCRCDAVGPRQAWHLPHHCRAAQGGAMAPQVLRDACGIDRMHMHTHVHIAHMYTQVLRDACGIDRERWQGG